MNHIGLANSLLACVQGPGIFFRTGLTFLQEQKASLNELRVSDVSKRGNIFSHHNHLVSLLVMVSCPMAVMVMGPLSRAPVPGSSGVVGTRGRRPPGHVHCVGVVIR